MITEKNVAAGIVDKRGTILRVVVEKRSDLWCHLAKGERAIILPKFEIDGDVAWNNIPNIVTRVEAYVLEQNRSLLSKIISWFK